MIILGVLQIATIYSTTFSQFLAVRSIFGLFMGGVYGNAIAMVKSSLSLYLSLSTQHIYLQLTNISTSQALENCPVDARGLMSGILQQGYSFGYVCAACANLGVGGSTESWKTVFWIAAGLSIGVGLIRVGFPESQQFRERKAAGHKGASPGVFWKETKQMLAREWKMCMLVFFFVVFLFFSFFFLLFFFWGKEIFQLLC